MRARPYLWLLVFLVIAGLVTVVVSLVNKHAPGDRGIVVSFSGYTNLPNNATRFAIFSIHNQDSLAVRWRGNWVEVEGLQHNKAPTVNHSLPWFTAPTLRSGDSLTVAVGEPSDGGRWRLSVLRSRYKLKERCLDFVMTHKWPTGIGRLSLLNAQQILSPTNCVTNSSVWLEK